MFVFQTMATQVTNLVRTRDGTRPCLGLVIHVQPVQLILHEIRRDHDHLPSNRIARGPNTVVQLDQLPSRNNEGWHDLKHGLG